MAKENPLMQGLDRKRKRKSRASEPPKDTPKEVPAYRVGRVLIAGHFAPEVQKALKFCALENDTTVQALLTQAINMLFAKYGKPELAGPPAPVEREEAVA
jgi:hypothetical protein